MIAKSANNRQERSEKAMEMSNFTRLLSIVAKYRGERDQCTAWHMILFKFEDGQHEERAEKAHKECKRYGLNVGEITHSETMSYFRYKE